MNNVVQLCYFEGPKYFFLSDQVPSLVYYSHIPLIVGTIIIAVLIFLKGKSPYRLINKIFFYTLLAFALWVIFSLLFWSNNRSDVVMLVWGWTLAVEPLVYIGMLYLVQAIIGGSDISFNQKLIIGLLYLPVLVLLPTMYSLPGFDIGTCLSIEGPLALYYIYAIEFIFTAWIIVYGINQYRRQKERRGEILLLTLGSVLFLVAFAWGNLIGSFTDNWTLGEFGLVGMPIFLGFLVYTIIKYQLFNIKLIGANVLVVVLWVLIGSLLFIQDINIVRTVVGATLLATFIFGIFLINSVRKEVILREQLQTANEGQTDLIHIINHQIKSYMTKARYIYDALLNDSDYGPISEKARPMIEKGYMEVTEGVNFVQDFLNAANVEKGTFTYDMQPLDFKQVVTQVSEKQKEIAKEKGLSLDLAVVDGDYNMKGDAGQLSQAVRNLIDNSIKYTPTGGLKVTLERKDDKILLTIKDTGLGISDELKPRLFTKGGRGSDSIKININSTGYGLSFVKGVVEAHQGRVWSESAGPNLGSTFYMELPVML